MKLKYVISGVVAATVLAAAPTKQASAGVDPFYGEIMWVGFTFCPRGWAEAAGQLLPIAQNTALFSLLGTTYGGDGRTTFALPDLRGRVSMSEGQGAGLSSRTQGQRLGAETETLSIQNMPSHNHQVNVSQGATENDASGSIPGSPRRTRIYDAATAANMTMASNALTSTGNNVAHNNMQPSLVLRACIALVGQFPSRN